MRLGALFKLLIIVLRNPVMSHSGGGWVFSLQSVPTVISSLVSVVYHISLTGRDCFLDLKAHFFLLNSNSLWRKMSLFHVNSIILVLKKDRPRTKASFHYHWSRLPETHRFFPFLQTSVSMASPRPQHYCLTQTRTKHT